MAREYFTIEIEFSHKTHNPQVTANKMESDILRLLQDEYNLDEIPEITVEWDDE